MGSLIVLLIGIKNSIMKSKAPAVPTNNSR